MTDNDDDPPLVEGGQGRTGHEVRESASALGWFTFFAVAGLVALRLLGVIK